MTSNTHIYFCSSTDCNMEVSNYHDICENCLHETLSHETSECPGCGNDIYCGANGYCANCWVDRFGADDDHHCSGEFDYESGCRVCDDDECPYSSPRPNSITSPQAVHYNYICRSCDENFYTTEPKGPHDRCCGECHLDAVSAIQRWWRDEREAKLTREPTSWYEVAPTQCTCNRKTGLMCDLCSEEYKEPCRGCGVNSDLWDERYCLPCYDDRYVAKPPRANIEADIENIEEKLRTRMTLGQTNDWERLLATKKRKLVEMNCPGCRDGVLNQQGHMVQGGCLDEPERTPWEDYDQDDLRKMDLANRRGW